jgi:hypothetical protein
MYASHPRLHSTIYRFALVVFLVLGLLCTSKQSYAAGQQLDRTAEQNPCLPSKAIDKWKNWKQLEKEDFHLQEVGPLTKISFEKEYMSMSLGRDLSTGNDEIYADITEIDPEHGLGQACWLPTADRTLVMEVSLRFDQAQTPPGLFENILLWNGGQTTASSPATGIGVTRSLSSPYSAVVSQDFVFAAPPQGLIRLVPMPAWLDATQWHRVRMTVTDHDASIEVFQGELQALVVQQQLLHAPDPLAVDFTIDNQYIPGINIPVQVADSIYIADFKIDYQ